MHRHGEAEVPDSETDARLVRANFCQMYEASSLSRRRLSIADLTDSDTPVTQNCSPKP